MFSFGIISLLVDIRQHIKYPFVLSIVDADRDLEPIQLISRNDSDIFS
jgi:hypothetical protein